jgi:hypothetical protein
MLSEAEVQDREMAALLVAEADRFPGAVGGCESLGAARKATIWITQAIPESTDIVAA